MARYRRHRTDFHAHPKTAGLSSLARDLMWYAIERGGLLGIVEQSPRRLAAAVGELAPGVPCTPRHIEAVLRELVEARVAVWWDDLETLWIVDCADEQAKGQKAWDGCLSQLSELHHSIGDAIRKRYPHLSDRSEIEEEGSPHTVPAPVTDPATDRTPPIASEAQLADAAGKRERRELTAAQVEGHWGQIRADLAAAGRPLDRKQWRSSPPDGLAELLEDYTPREIVDIAVRRRNEMADDDEFTWTHAMFRPKVWGIATSREGRAAGQRGGDDLPAYVPKGARA